MRRAGIRPSEVRLIVLTHGHWDHVGSARDVKALPVGKLAILQRDRACVERSVIPLPPGVTTWGKVFIAVERLFLPLIKTPATLDIVLGDEPFSLHEYGIPRRVLYTPGHSLGSVSVLLATGDAFVDDRAMNGFRLEQRRACRCWRRTLPAWWRAGAACCRPVLEQSIPGILEAVSRPSDAPRYFGLTCVPPMETTPSARGSRLNPVNFGNRHKRDTRVRYRA